MVTFLVFADGDSEWRLERDVFRERLLNDWVQARLVPEEAMGKSEMRDLGWHLDLDGREIEGWSSRTVQGITLDGDEDLATRLAAWFRALMPEDTDVTFCDSMYSFDFTIPFGADADEVMRLYVEASSQ